MNINHFFEQIHPKGEKKLEKQNNTFIYQEIKSKQISLPHQFGKISITLDREFQKEIFQLQTEFSGGNKLTWEDFIYFDIETTGLSAGAGNFPFLTGVLFVKENRIIIEQFLSYEFSGFSDLICAMKERFGNFRCLVSYNGKSFDRHVLTSHMLLNRQPTSILMDKDHIDLLHISRLIWKNQLSSFSLKDIEKNILHFSRSNDITGKEAADYYIMYQTKKDINLIEPILKHNEWDLISLLALTWEISKRWETIKFNTTSKIFLLKKSNKLKKENISQKLMLSLKDEKISGDNIHAYREELTKYYKRRNKFEEAEKILLKTNTLESLLELAKLYEHKMKEYDKALEITQTIKNLIIIKNGIEELRGEATNQELYLGLEKRIKRLKRKKKNSREKET